MYRKFPIVSSQENRKGCSNHGDCRVGMGTFRGVSGAIIHEARLFDMILDPKGLPEREGGFQARGIGPSSLDRPSFKESALSLAVSP